MKKIFILLLLLNVGFQISATTLPPMKLYKSRNFFGNTQMRSIIDFCNTYQKYAFMSFEGDGTIKILYSISGKQKTSIDIDIFNNTYGKEIQLKVSFYMFMTCPGNYNPNNTLKCIQDMSRFINIDHTVIKQLDIVFNKYIINNRKYKNHNVQIVTEALRRGGLLKEFQKHKPKYDTGEVGFYFQLTKKWRLYVFIRKEKDKHAPIYYRLTTDSGEEKFIINLTKK